MARSRTKSPRQMDREIEDFLAGDGQDVPAGSKIVVAWTEDVQEIAPGQKAWRHDLGERPKFVDAKKPHAAMWTNSGTAADLAKAKAYLQKEQPVTGRVFVYPPGEQDPLVRARREILSSPLPRASGAASRASKPRTRKPSPGGED